MVNGTNLTLSSDMDQATCGKVTQTQNTQREIQEVSPIPLLIFVENFVEYISRYNIATPDIPYRTIVGTLIEHNDGMHWSRLSIKAPICS